MVISDAVISIHSKQDNARHDRVISKSVHTVKHYLLLMLQLSIRQTSAMFDFEVQI